MFGRVATAGTKIGDEGPGGRAADQLLPEALKKTKDLAPHRNVTGTSTRISLNSASQRNSFSVHVTDLHCVHLIL